jgi:hypothetical protein
MVVGLDMDTEQTSKHLVPGSKEPGFLKYCSGTPCMVVVIVLAKHDFKKEHVFVETTDGLRVSLCMLLL